ncbi:MAG TPA: hypothetical protein VNA20_15220 [Frankiaceae bacterium]|nr:hypothetical protein [Frankiaceae bacterium]
MTTVQRQARRVSRRWTTLFAVALLAPLGSATANAAPPARPTLTGTTTINWSGAAKITLNVPRQIGSFTEDRMRLFVSRGTTYAFVRIVSPPNPTCVPVTVPHCMTIRLDYLSDLSARLDFPTAGRGHDHMTELPTTPPYLWKGPTTFFLFTDGQATLELRPPGVTGRSSHVARGKFRGRAERLPIRCASGMCTPASPDPLLYGGDVFDLGKAPGSVDTIVYSTTVKTDLVPGAVPANQPHGLRQCVYPNPRTAPTASPGPADHPHGCDFVPQRPDDALDVAEGTANEAIFAHPYTGVVFSWWFADVTGPRYVGWHAASAGPAPTIRSAYAVWYSYTA